MLTKSLKIGGGILLALAMMLPEMTLPAAAFPPPQIQVNPLAELGFEESVILIGHRRGHRYYGRRGGGWHGHGYRRDYGYGNRYYGGSGLYLNFGLPYGYYGGYGGYGVYDDAYGYGGYSGGYGNSHVRWCLNRYRSYNPRTNTFVGHDGYRRRCRSPY